MNKHDYFDTENYTGNHLHVEKTFGEYRKEWIARGTPWVNPKKRPLNWKLQLKE